MVRRFNVERLVRHRLHNYKSLPELLVEYPGRGVGFKVWQKDWPEGRYYVVSRSMFTNLKRAEYFGLSFEQGKQVSPLPVLIPHTYRRGTWQYSSNGAGFVTDQGVVYEPWEM
jgi:hypothetical protein